MCSTVCRAHSETHIAWRLLLWSPMLTEVCNMQAIWRDFLKRQSLVSENVWSLVHLCTSKSINILDPLFWINYL
jgi:hypothetical protein